MSLKLYMILLSVGTALCWAAWLVVLFTMDPESAGGIALISFYVSLFLALIGTFTLGGFSLRALVGKNKLPFKFIGISVRQGALFAVLIIVSLMLQGADLFQWWSAIFLILALAVLEAFFLIKTA